MPLDYEKLMRMKFEPFAQTYTRKDTMLYALGLGVGSQDPGRSERAEVCVRARSRRAADARRDAGRGRDAPRRSKFGINYRMLLHAEQSLRMHKPLPVEGTVISQSTFDEIYDKGAAKGAIMYMTRTLHDEATGDLLVTMATSSFLRADGGFGGKSEGAPKPRPVPADRPPDLAVILPGSLNQALIYRLAGDYNPLHSDPEVARSAGFERPILHGLCAYGMVGRALLKVLGGDDPNDFKRARRSFHEPCVSRGAVAGGNLALGPGDAAFRLVATNRKVVVEDFGRFEYAARVRTRVPGLATASIMP